MEDKRLPPLMEYFSDVQDPRRETKNKKYPLIQDSAVFCAFIADFHGLAEYK